MCFDDLWLAIVDDSLFFHFFQDWDDLLKGGPLAGVFVHTNPDQLCHVV
jgi:hypothetical protein